MLWSTMKKSSSGSSDVHKPNANVAATIRKEDALKQTIHPVKNVNIQNPKPHIICRNPEKIKIQSNVIYPARKNVTFEVAQNATPEVIQNVTPEVIQNVTPEVIQNVTPEVVQNVTQKVIQNLPSEVIINVASDVQLTDPNNVFYQMDGTPVHVGDFQYLEQCDDSTIILHKELPSYDVDIVSQNISLENFQSVDLTDNNSEVGQNVDLTRIDQDEGSSKLDMPSLDLEDSLEVDQTKDLTSLDHEENSSSNLKSDSNAENSQKNVVTTSYVVAGDNYTSKDPVDTEVVWLPSLSPRIQLQEFLEFPNDALKDKNLKTTSSDETSARTKEKERSEVADKSIAPPKVMVKRSIAAKVTENQIIKPSPISKTYEKIKPPISVANNEKIDTVKCYTLTKMEICKEWLKYSDLPGFKQDLKLFDYVCSKVNFARVIESRDQVKNLISFISHKLSNMFDKCGRCPNALLDNTQSWLNGPCIVFTPTLTDNKTNHTNNHTSPVYTETYTEPPLPHKMYLPRKRPQKLYLQMNLDTNADVFKFLTKSQTQFRAEALHTILIAICRDNIRNIEHYYGEDLLKLKEFCVKYVSDLKFKFMTVDYKEDVFESKFAFWLRLNVRWPAFIKDVLSSRPKVTPSVDVIKELEKCIAKKCCENGKEHVVEVIHRLLHHPEDAARIRAFVDNSRCHCDNPQSETSDINNSIDLDPLIVESEKCRTSDTSEGFKLTKNNTYEKVYKAPSGQQLNTLKQALNKLKENTPQDPFATVEEAPLIFEETEQRNMLKLVVEKSKRGTPLEPNRTLPLVSTRSGVPLKSLKNIPREALRWVPLNSLKRVPRESPTSISLVAPTNILPVSPSSILRWSPTSIPLVSPASDPLASPASIPSVPPTSISRETRTSIPLVSPASIPLVSPASIPSVPPTSISRELRTSIPLVSPASIPVVSPASNPRVSPTSISRESRTSIPLVSPASNPRVSPTSISRESRTSIPLVSPSIPLVSPASIPRESPSIPLVSRKRIPFVSPKSSTLPITEEPNGTASGTKLVFGPVLDRIVYLKPELPVKNGSTIQLTKGRLATIVKVSNLRGVSVLLPISNIKRGAKVHAKCSNKSANVLTINSLKSSTKNATTSTIAGIKGESTDIQKSTRKTIPTNRTGKIDAPSVPLKVATAPSIVNKVMPATFTNKALPAILRKNKLQANLSKQKPTLVPSSSTIKSSVNALIADINSGNMQQSKTQVQSLKNHLARHTKLMSEYSSESTTSKGNMIAKRPTILNYTVTSEKTTKRLLELDLEFEGFEQKRIKSDNVIEQFVSMNDF